MSSDKAEKAVRDLTSDYYDSVRAIAKEADDLIRERGLQDPEDFDAWLHETCDGNYWVIYTHANLQAMVASDNWLAIEDDYGIADGGNGLVGMLPQYAYFALRADILQRMELDGSDPDAYEE